MKLLAATPSQVLEGITGPEGRELTVQLNGLGEDEVSEGGRREGGGMRGRVAGRVGGKEEMEDGRGRVGG